MFIATNQKFDKTLSYEPKIRQNFVDNRKRAKVDDPVIRQMFIATNQKFDRTLSYEPKIRQNFVDNRNRAKVDISYSTDVYQNFVDNRTFRNRQKLISVIRQMFIDFEKYDYR